MADQNPVPEPESPFDPFELVASIVLGIGAVGAALASYQSSQWGGKMSEAYGQAAVLTTKASTQYNERVADISHDYHVDILAKVATLEAMYGADEDAKAKGYEVASRLYVSYLNEEAYAAMKLPREAQAADAEDLPPATLDAALDTELDEHYVDTMLEEANAGFAEADRKFQEGRDANTAGDGFSLVVVVFTIGLFFAGLSTTFKSRMRWGMVGCGALIIGGSTVSMLMMPWA